MVEKCTYASGPHWCRRNAEMIFSAALLLKQVHQEDHDVRLELEAMVRRLDELGFTIVKSGFAAVSQKVAA